VLGENMKYIVNITDSNVRVAGRIEATAGGHVHESVQLEPSVVTVKVDPDTREREVRPGQNVAEVPDEWFENREFTRSHNVLFTDITEDQFNERQDLIDSYAARTKDEAIEIPSHLGRDQFLRFDPKKSGATTQDILRIPMDEETLSIHAGALEGTRSRPDNMAGKKLSDGVRRADGEGQQLDPHLESQMGQA
jgi:hypothetical protein